MAACRTVTSALPWPVLASASIRGSSPLRRMSSPRSAPACSTAIRMSFSISLGRTISLESVCEALTTVSTSNCRTGVPMVEVDRSGKPFLAQVRVEFVELLHLAVGRPSGRSSCARCGDRRSRPLRDRAPGRYCAASSWAKPSFWTKPCSRAD